MPVVPTEQLREGSPGEREAAASEIREIATEEPQRLHGALDQIAGALDEEHEAIRRYVATTLFEVGVDDPRVVAPVAEALVAALEDESTAVRMGVARPLAELAAANPQRVRFAIDDLVPSLTDVKSVRHSVAWALSSLAPRYPEVLHGHVDDITRALLDDHHPVQTYVLRLLVPLERCYPGLLDVVTERLRDLLTAEVAAVRQAACRAVVAHDPAWAQTLLHDVARDDPHPIVRETAQAELMAHTSANSSPPIGLEANDETVFERAGPGHWLAVRTDREQDLPFLAGRVTAITRAKSEADLTEERERGLRREDFDTRQAWLAAPQIDPSGERTAVHLHDPFADRGINLVRVAQGIGGEFTTPDQQVPRLLRPTEIVSVEPDRARLLAASPGDTLSFAIEGAAHEIEVQSAGTDSGIYRVTGQNAERGYTITFRPLGDNPTMAVFEQGRAFPATDLSLSVDE
jgi:HEAT repeat protein